MILERFTAQLEEEAVHIIRGGKLGRRGKIRRRVDKKVG